MPATTTGRLRSEADKARSDADRTSSEHDVARADADQRASHRDRTDSERDEAVHASTDAKFMEAFSAIQAERSRSTADRRVAAGDRACAAADRAVASEDRRHAALDRAQARNELEQARNDLEEAQLDELTGFYRLGLGTAVLQHEIDRSRRSGRTLTIAYCDVDGLKRVNDECGHAAGDALLKGVAAAMRSRLRQYDPVVRVGGDEFVCALSEVELDQAIRLMNDIQDILARDLEGASMSFGLATLTPSDDLATLLERSDLALREGRSAAPGTDLQRRRIDEADAAP